MSNISVCLILILLFNQLVHFKYWQAYGNDDESYDNAHGQNHDGLH